MVDPRPATLDVVGQLMVEMGGESVRINAEGGLISVELPDLRSAASILKRWPGGSGSRRSLGQIHEGLTRAGLSLEVKIGSRRVGRLGVGARAGLASRLLRLGPLEVDLGSLLGSLRPTQPRRE